MANSGNRVVLTLFVSIITGTLAAVFVVGISGVFVWANRPAVADWLNTGNTVAMNADIQVDTTNLTTQETVIVETVAQVQPAVVSIVISKDVPIIEGYFKEDSFGDLFGFPSFDVPQYQENETEEQEIGGGSGFLVSNDGYILTNKHVAEDADASYTVFLQDGTQYEAEVTALDPLNDIAVLKIEATDLPFLEFGDSDALQVGQTVIAIGNALSEFENSVSSGIISGLSRSIIAGDGFGETEELEDVIQTDAAINPGNSGGPLLNLSGAVIGINVAVAYGSENIGFALPANAVASAVESVKATGKISRPFLGVRYEEVTEELIETNNLSVDHGVILRRGLGNQLAVVPGSPADKAGLEENDVILELNGQTLDEDHSLARLIAGHEIGESITLTVQHDGEEKTVDVTLEEYKEQITTGTTKEIEPNKKPKKGQE